MFDVAFILVEGGMKMKGAFRKRDAETPAWKYVGSDVISSMGLTSSVRKVMPKSSATT